MCPSAWPLVEMFDKKLLKSLLKESIYQLKLRITDLNQFRSSKRIFRLVSTGREVWNGRNLNRVPNYDYDYFFSGESFQMGELSRQVIAYHLTVWKFCLFKGPQKNHFRTWKHVVPLTKVESYLNLTFPESNICNL